MILELYTHETLWFQFEKASEIASLLQSQRTCAPGRGVWVCCGQKELGLHLHHRRGRVSCSDVQLFAS